MQQLLLRWRQQHHLLLLLLLLLLIAGLQPNCGPATVRCSPLRSRRLCSSGRAAFLMDVPPLSSKNIVCGTAVSPGAAADQRWGLCGWTHDRSIRSNDANKLRDNTRLGVRKVRYVECVATHC